MPYVQRIEVRNHYKLPDFDIDLGEIGEGPQFRHLILTGPNGSGKTTILTKLADLMAVDLTGINYHRRSTKEKQLSALAGASGADLAISNVRKELAKFSAEAFWSPEPPKVQEVLMAFLPAHRQLQVDKPRGIEKLDLGKAAPQQQLARAFLKHLVNLEVQSRLAKDDDPQMAWELAEWLKALEQALGTLFDIPGLRLEFVRKEYDIRFVEPSGATYDFNQLADGHASVINILAEILLRAPDGSLTTTDGAFATQPGVVIIDELETHIHPSLQERLLPFLVRAFPRVQFIVATHSPVVISSIDNAKVWDLGSMEDILSDELRGTPYGDLMKIHFGIETDFDLESTRQLKRLKELRDTQPRSTEEQAEFEQLAGHLRKTSHALALEVWIQLEQTRLRSVGA